ncbi:MAG: outer membrane beta-barrel protein [Syntrophales bacterium]
MAKRAINFSCLITVMLLLIPTMLLAQGNINFGNLKVIPGIEGQVVYDDNIYMKNGSDDNANKKVSDTIYHIKPGMLLNFNMPERGDIKLGWNGDWAFYNTNDKNNWNNQNFALGVDYKPPSGLIFGLNDEQRQKQDPFGSPDQYAIGRTTKRWENDLKSKLGMTWGNNTFRTNVIYNRFQQQYASNYDASQNYALSEYGVSAEGRFLPRTWGFVRYLYGIQNYESFYGGQTDNGTYVAGFSDNRKSDFKYNQVNVGLNWDQGSKLTGELSVGYMWKRYDNNLDTAGNTRSDRDTWVAATNINFDATATTVLSLNLARTPRDQSADSSTFFYDTGVGLNVRQTILTRFFATAGVLYSLNDYNTAPAGYTSVGDRSDKNYIANAGLDYKIREWLTCGIAYKYNKKTSNYSAFEYADNQFMASVKIVY